MSITNDRISTIADYLNRNGYTKKLRQNNMLPTFSANFVKDVLDNPIYCGKIAYGRRRTEKKVGTRNETHTVWADDFPVHDGLHEAIVSEETWQLAQEKRKKTCFAKEKPKDPNHAHILSGILKCPCCGKGLYPLESRDAVETVMMLPKLSTSEHIDIHLDMNELDVTKAESQETAT